MKVTYLGHSGFLVELEQVAFLFDYYTGEVPPVSKDKDLYVLVSHKHQDHFQHRIFQLAKEYPSVRFLLSKDCRMNEAYMERKQIPVEARRRISYVGPDQHWKSENASPVTVRTLRSTDEGVAFLVEAEGKRLYHAGDLNWWTWPGEETDAEYEAMTKAFLKEMEKLRGESFDVAFVPLDPRQGERYDWGFHQFAVTAEAKWLFPMHMWEDYAVVDRLIQDPKSEAYRQSIVSVHRAGEVWER